MQDLDKSNSGYTIWYLMLLCGLGASGRR